MKAKIIIVEDHEPIRNELKILLSKYGYEIIVLDRFDTVVEVTPENIRLRKKYLKEGERRKYEKRNEE